MGLILEGDIIKKITKRKSNKAIVSQDNRLIYAKYDMNTNEIKFFMWVIAQIYSQKEQLFQICEIPVNELFTIFGHQENSKNHMYVKSLIDGMARKVYIEDFKLLDKNTMKEVNVHQAMPIFKFLRYKDGDGYISYQLNDSLQEYLLDLKRDFTQIKFKDIQKMRSAYSIRIYNMLVCELKQNKLNLKISLAALQNILEVPKILLEYKHFKQKILIPSQKDINKQTEIELLDIKPIKEGRKIVELNFIFDYKDNSKRTNRDFSKKINFNNKLEEKLKKYYGSTLLLKDLGEVILTDTHYKDEQLFLLVTRKINNECVYIKANNPSIIDNIKKAIKSVKNNK